jgi:hypothetical protein
MVAQPVIHPALRRFRQEGCRLAWSTYQARPYLRRKLKNGKKKKKSTKTQNKIKR